jgi:predicted nucleic acid-binding protein
MIVIADTTPLNYLSLIERQELLHQLFGQVIIPQAVFDELCANKTPHVVRQWIASRPLWIGVKSVTLLPDSALMQLDLGERQAILLAQELQADLLIADDRAARDEAAKRNLPAAGTLGVLELAAEKGLIDFPQILIQLKQTSFYISEFLEKLFLERDKRRKFARQAQTFSEPGQKIVQEQETDK